MGWPQACKYTYIIVKADSVRVWVFCCRFRLVVAESSWNLHLSLHAAHVGIHGRVDAACCEDAVSWGIPADADILWNFRRSQIWLFACDYRRINVSSVCNPRYSGEYIINYISLLIISIYPSDGATWKFKLNTPLVPILATRWHYQH